MSSYIRHFINLYSQSPLSYGATDICSGDSFDSASRTGAFAVVMNVARTQEHVALIDKILIIAPPVQANADLNEANVYLSIVAAAEGHFGRTLAEGEKIAIGQQVKTIHTDSLSITSVVKALQSATGRSAVMILNAASYRDERLSSPCLATAEPHLPEDLWVPHLVELARAVTEVAKSIPCYMLIDTGESHPHKVPNQEALKSVPDCGLFICEPQNDPSALVASNVLEWQNQVKAGNVGSAFKSIDALPDWMNSQKSFIKLQLLEHVVPSPEMTKLLRSEIDTKKVIDPKARLKMAAIAHRAEDENITLEMLGPAISGLTGQEDLELALEIAAGTTDQSIVDQVRQRLEALFPQSTQLLKSRLTEFINARMYADILLLLANEVPSFDQEVRFCYRTLALALRSSVTPEYMNAIRAIDRTVPEQGNWARIICSREALARREFVTAINLCLPSGERQLTAGTARMLLRATREFLLQRNAGGELAITGDQLQEPVLAVIHYLSAHPKDGTTRMILASLLSVETSGRLGFAVILSATLKLAGATVLPRSKSNRDKPEPRNTELDITLFLRNALEWMASESPVILEFANLPPLLLTAPPDELFQNLKQVIKCDQDLRDDATEDTFEKLVWIGVLVAAHTTEPNEDLDLLRYAASQLVGANRLQRARDLAEQALAITRGTAERRRLAWLAFADIYHRARNAIDSLIGMACVFAVDVSIDLEQLWQEGYLLIRILRDLHFTDHAKSALDLLRTLAEHLEPRKRYDQRLTTLELGMRLSDLTRRTPVDAQGFDEITKDIERHCSELLSDKDEIAPAAALLSHCIYLSTFLGLTPNTDAVATLKRAIPDISPPLAALLHAVTSKETSARQLLTLAQSIEAARNPEDIAFDLTNIAIAARRFLDTRSLEEAAEASVFAIELLADHAIRGSLIGTLDSPVSALEITAERAAEISRLGICVVFLGLAESGRLVRVNVEDGRLEDVVREDENVFSGRKLQEWARQFPYGYAAVEDPMNLFYVSTDGLGLSLAPSTATVLVMDNSLQELPPNLVRIGNDFAGRMVPMASAPSMSWMWAARRSPAPRSNRRKAWISTEAGEGKNPALTTIADRLRDCLSEHRIDLNTSASLPDDLNDAELVVIAAHGGILPEGRVIQRVSDDANLAMYPATLASAVNGSSIVVLFVCSGGRIDSHPTGETTVGLVKELLNQGCSTIIASPWPLNVSVPPHWLPVFLREWIAGKTPTEATFLANKEVEKRLGDAPLDCLAMNVFGDPLRRKS
jgi:hypothetical protein